MKQLKATIKLLGMSKEVDGNYFAMVAPFVLTRENPLYSVDDVMNAILVTGNTLGDTMYYGAGAGKLPTASAVVSDVIDCAMHEGIHLACNWKPEKLPLSDMDQAERKFFVRAADTDEAQIKELFGEVKMLEPVKADETAFVTPVMTEKTYKEKAAALNVISMIRVEVSL